MQMENVSYWLKSTQNIHLDELSEDIKTDVAIVGDGIAALTTALLLAEKGIECTVFEANEIGHGATGFTTAKVTIQHGLIYSHLLNHIDENAARKYADINREALANIRRIIEEYNIECDYVTTASNVYASSKASVDNLLREYIVAKSLGIDVSFDDDISLPFKAYANLKVENQGMFHPVKYTNGIAEVLQEKQVKVYEHTRIVNIEGEDGYTLITHNGNKISAQKVVIATKYPILNKKKLMFTKLYVERSYIVACQMPNFKIDGFYINGEGKVRSIRQFGQGDERLVLVAGGNHEAGDCENAEQSYLDLIKFAKKLDDDAKIKYKWSTQDCMTMDKMPYIGELSDDMPGIYIVTGFNKWGMSQSMAAAIILSDEIVGAARKGYDLFSPHRKLKGDAKKEMMKQGADVAGDYIKVVQPVNKNGIDDISIGHGEIIKYNGEVLGVYKDENGEIFSIVPKCPHMGCRLKFNQAEKTWDCPCHGSRFTYKGEVIESPAVSQLESKD